MKANVMNEPSLTDGILFLTKEIATFRMTKKIWRGQNNL
jgi:hypothetical protein